jgi:anti-anti-sigma factor
MFNYQTLKREPIVQVVFEGDMDIEATEIIEEQIIPEFLEYTSISINFSNISFVDSSGIGLLITLIQSLKERGIRVTIHHIKPDVMEVFSLLQLPDIVGRGVFEE